MRMLAAFGAAITAAFLAGTIFATSNIPAMPRQLDLYSIQSAEAVVDSTGDVEIFAKFDKISGESVASGHTNEIDVISYRFDLSQDADPDTGIPEGDPIFRDFYITKWLDKSSPSLFIKAAEGEHIATMELSVRKAGGSIDFLKLKLTDVEIKSYGDNSAGLYPREYITMTYTTIEVTYQPLKADGTADGVPIKEAWNLNENREISTA